MRTRWILPLLLLATGSCGKTQPVAMTAAPDAVAASMAELRAWLPTDRDVAGYFRSAELVGAGRLAARDGALLRIELEHVFHGRRPGETLEAIAAGGVLRQQVGDEVIFAANLRDGRWTLHSFCPVPGLFHRNADLARRLQREFPDAQDSR
ncbi:MAG: hypothetical protein U0939_18805 [Pirellulales bacterium]